jgi:hypothetical protein
LEEFERLVGIINDLRLKYNSSGQPYCSLPVQAVSETTTCSICGATMKVSKTVPRHIQTIANGQLHVMEQHRSCPNGCLDPKTGMVVHSRSDNLASLVQPGCRYGYDVESHIGLAMYINNRHVKEVHEELLSKGIDISIREVSNLAKKFLDHLENVHISNCDLLSHTMKKSGGYVAHIDATCVTWTWRHVYRFIRLGRMGSYGWENQYRKP